ncbi:MAG: T9SS type A sorting domain-containing protein [bacterium]|nr:T9SS type A sorting domain-containing protein [bacterium]
MPCRLTFARLRAPVASTLAIPALMILALATAVAPVGAAEPLSPLAPEPGAAPWSGTYHSQQHRAREAESKARAGMRLQKAEASRPAGAAKAMSDYDVRWYGLVLDLNPTTRIVTGTTTVRAQVVNGPLTSLQLDFGSQMTASAARSAGVPASFTWNSGILAINLDRAYGTGEIVDVAIDYAGNPSSSGFGWNTYQGQPLIWTLSEPYGARIWWPCKDTATDKADSVSLDVTVPSNLIVASNGVLTGVSTPVAGKKTYHWRERYPIATYLVSLAIHPYAIINDVYYPQDGGTMPVTHYVLPSQLGAATAGYAVTVDMIEAFADAFGEYPFVAEKYGHAQFPWGGGMEHQTCSSMYYNNYDEYLIAHELGHQWFGDLVTCADFSHIWLNEGFATWLEAYWKEVRYGIASYHAEMAAARYLGAGTIFVENPNDFSAIFDYYLSYLKASWVPHMLRHVLGDEAFFAALKQYRDTHGFGAATTEQFQAVMESASGRDLAAFFQQWIYGEYFPRYDYSWRHEPAGAGWRVRLRIKQSQTNAGLFVMPLDVRIDTAGGPYTFVVQNDAPEQWYALEVPSAPTAVTLDPEDWVLCETRFLGVSDVPDAGLALGLEAAPNPFNPRTTVRFTLGEEGQVALAVHDAAGRLVAVLAGDRFAAGQHAVTWDGRDREGRAAASGTYFARLRAGDQTRTLALTLVR